MNKCAFVLPYFGKFKNYFPLFLKSFKFNNDFDLIIFTDNKYNYDYPQNVYVHYMEFNELKNLIYSKIPFDIRISTPYKLCDYKVAYGLIFEEYLKPYKFWGFCDCDLIFGDLSKFINDKLMNEYDRIFSLGHLSLFRNTYEINRLFLKESKGMKYAERVFGSDEIFGFDEMVMNKIIELYGKKIFSLDLSANVSVYYYRFRLVKRDYQIERYLTEDYTPSIYAWRKGKIIRKYISDDNGQMVVNEFPYIHLQQRKMKFDNSVLQYDEIQILPNTFKKLCYGEKCEINNMKKNHFDFMEIINCKKRYLKWKVKSIISHLFPGRFLRGNF